MPLKIKSLGYGLITSNEPKKLIPLGAGQYAEKPSLITNIRFVNGGSANVQLTLSLKQKVDTTETERTISNPIIIPPSAMLLIDEEIIVDGSTVPSEPKDAVFGTIDAGSLDYVISGFERE